MQIWCFSVGLKGKKLLFRAILDDLEWKKNKMSFAVIFVSIIYFLKVKSNPDCK